MSPGPPKQRQRPSPFCLECQHCRPRFPWRMQRTSLCSSQSDASFTCWMRASPDPSSLGTMSCSPSAQMCAPGSPRAAARDSSTNGLVQLSGNRIRKAILVRMGPLWRMTRVPMNCSSQLWLWMASPGGGARLLRWNGSRWHTNTLLAPCGLTFWQKVCPASIPPWSGLRSWPTSRARRRPLRVVVPSREQSTAVKLGGSGRL
mmetsp:Transcript_12152/g.26981  ORF Transcript_12152/g.26981 Transcript_12152/m.26981 type:complete len:203 (+) Transcript_12152:509-1117(+)